MNKNRTQHASISQNRPKRRDRTRVLILWLLIAGCTLAAVASGALFPTGTRNAKASQTVDDISPEALAQIDALIREKESRTAVQKKIDSQLIYQSKMARGQLVADNLPALQTDVAVDDQGKTTVDITATVTDTLVGTLRANGAEILSRTQNSIRALVSLDSIETIAALDEVKFVQPKQDSMTANAGGPMIDDAHGDPSTLSVMPGFDERAARVQSFLSQALPGGSETNVTGTNAGTGVGSRSSEGDITHRANIARGTFHIDGTGIKIGVLSNGVISLAQSQALGDLGPVTVLPGQAGASGDEGTAMLEIIHDLAPGAQLYFATANTSITQFAQNIRDLRTAGCDIIVDDVFYFVESPFQDGQVGTTNTNGGVVTQAVVDVTADGAMYFSSAGNSGNLTQNTAGVWEGDFVDGGAAAAPLPTPTPASRLHNFGGQNFDVLSTANTAAPISLYWADPLGASSNDYDLFRLNSTGTTVQASSTNIQSGTQDPYEQVTQAAGSRIVIVKKSGSADRFLHLNANRGTFSIRTAGTTHGHSHAANAFSCAATPANTPFGAAPNPTGPFPNPFSAANVTEIFSSDGPRRIFFQADGTPYTAGNFSSTGGIVRQKPDITAADGVQVTGVGGFGSPFFGTSAAAPHAAAIAGLIKSANPSFTPAQIRTALTSTAIDIMAPGTDNVSGAGIIDPFSATQSLGVAGTAFMQATNITALENPGDGNGVLDAGEDATMTVQLRNDGVSAATAISATLSSSTPGVTITQASSAYPDLAVGASGTNATPFQFKLAGFVTCPTTLNFSLTLNYSGGPSQVLNFSVLAGPQPTVISSTLDTTPPTSGAGYTGTTGALTIRHFRDGVSSSCGTNKAFPGTSTAGNHQYDAYTFQTCATSGPTCVTVTLSAANGVNLFTAAYLGSFNPANLAQNYIADAGGSNTTISYSFNLPAGPQTFTIVVEDVPVGAASNSPYTLSVSGACVGVCPIVPVLAANGSTLSQESCPTTAVDPGELVTMNLKVINNGTGATSNLVGTLQSSANVISPSGPTSFGAIAPGATVGQDFTFTAAGNCGDLVTLALKLQDGSTDYGTVFYSFRLGTGTPGTPLSENFDGVTDPALPAGWTSTGSGSEPAWVTSTTNPSSAPNAAYAPDVATAGVTELVSPTIHINGLPAQVSFKNAFNTESGFDGGVLEISINGGAYQDIITAGGSFVSGGYNPTVILAAGTQNPLTGRNAWTGLSGGTTAAPTYITSVVNLPAAAAGQDIQLKWRMGSDELIAATGTQPGQRIDNIVVTDTSYSCAPCGKQDQTITFNPLPDKTYGDPDFQVSATASSGLPVSFTTSGSCTNTGDMIHLTGKGSCTVTAHQAGDSSYNAAPDVARTFNVLSAVLNISMTADRNPALVGYNHNYLISITNTGNASATNVMLSDPLPPATLVRFTAVTTNQGTCSYNSGTHTVNCSLGTLGAGGTINIQLTVKSLQPGTLNNTATITAGQWDPATGNSSASVNGLPAIAQVDLSVSKTDSADPVYVSQNVTYTMVVKNYNTPLSATGVVLTDNLPASMTFVSATTSQGSLITPPVGSSGIVTANIGTLAVNATATVTVTVTANSPGTITNTASASANESEANPANNTASQGTSVLAASLQKVLLAKQVLTGGCENTTGNVYLTGPAPAGGLTVNLSTTSLAGVTVPASVFIPAGQTVSPNFSVTTSPVATKQVGTVNATVGMSTVSRGLTINVGSGTCPP